MADAPAPPPPADASSPAAITSLPTDIRSLAFYAWCASFAHLLVVFSMADSISLATTTLVVTALGATLPGIWSSSVLLFAPGDVSAAYASLFAKPGHAPVVAKRAEADDARESDGPAGTIVTSRRATAPSPPPSPSPSPSPPPPPRPRPRPHPHSDDSDVDDDASARSWQDAITGIQGMAQALADANASASLVALNADLTVALAALMRNTIKLLHPTGSGANSAASSEDARVMRIVDPHVIVNDTSALAEPLFDDGCPLVLYNRLEPGDSCFAPRDTFECALYALVYRAGTRVCRGECLMLAEKVKAKKKRREREEETDAAAEPEARSISHWSPYDRVGVVNADP
jgi:hypothetical protein